MNYLVEFFGNEISVGRAGSHDEIARVNFVTGDANFLMDHLNVTTDASWLHVLFADLETNLQKLGKKAKRYRSKKSLRWELDGLKFKFSSAAGISKGVKEFSTLVKDMKPLLELGEIIFKQLERNPLNATTSFKLFMPTPMIDGLPLKGWLEERERAGLKIDANTAEVACDSRPIFDPYQVYPELPEKYSGYFFKEWFARNPGTKAWVWFGDLPRTTQDALWKRNRRSFCHLDELKVLFPYQFLPCAESPYSI